MIAKRLGAIALTVAMIVGAWLIRSEVIDDDGGVSGDDDPPPTEREIVCVSDLRDACNALADTRDDLDIRIEAAGTTLEALGALTDPTDAPIWITMEPFPAMVDDLRVRTGPLGAEQTDVASSPIALVMPSDRAAVLTEHCGPELDWDCIGQAAGGQWRDIGGDALTGDVRPAFAPIDSAIGLLGVADAVSGYFGGAPIAVNDTAFLSWARRLGTNAVPQSALTGGTPIATIQSRPSALDIAVGAEAELTDAEDSRFTLEYAEPMIRADVVVSVPAGASLPNALVDDLRRILVAEGWDASPQPNPLPQPVELFAIRETWREFS